MTTREIDECLDGVTVQTPAAAVSSPGRDLLDSDLLDSSLLDSDLLDSGLGDGPGLTDDGAVVTDAGPDVPESDPDLVDDGGPDVVALLDTMVARRASVDRAEADVLALVVEFADASPADADPGLLKGSVGGPSRNRRSDASDGSNASPSGVPSGAPSGAPSGVPVGVAETAVVELAARLGVSFRATAGMVTDALELRDRLPRLWELVQAGQLQAWKARRVAAVTTTLSDLTVAFIDRQVAITGRRNRLPDLRKLVIVAINTFDPDLAEGLEEAALAERDVTFDYSSSTDTAATARVEATMDVLDALDLDATVTDLAATMGRLGDDSPVGVRRARALGTLANPQRTLDLFGDPATPTLDDTDTDTDTDIDQDPVDDTDTNIDIDIDIDGDGDGDGNGNGNGDGEAAGAGGMAEVTDAATGFAPETSRSTDTAAETARIAHPQQGGPTGQTGQGREASGDAAAFTRPQQSRPRPRMPWDGQNRWNSQVGHLYLHLDAADLRALLADGDRGAGAVDGAVTGAADVERLGAASLNLVRDWLGRVTRVSVRPVLHLNPDPDSDTARDRCPDAETHLGADDPIRPVDQHDPPPGMRDLVILRDGHCVFPGCGIHARACDQDHIDPYVPIDHGGPPGQTRPGNLACLCRRHHRMKTHHDWHYQRNRDGTYAWTDSRGVGYTTASEALHPRPPDLSRPDLSRPDLSRPDLSRPDRGRPDPGHPDLSAPDTC